MDSLTHLISDTFPILNQTSLARRRS